MYRIPFRRIFENVGDAVSILRSYAVACESLWRYNKNKKDPEGL